MAVRSQGSCGSLILIMHMKMYVPSAVAKLVVEEEKKGNQIHVC